MFSVVKEILVIWYFFLTVERIRRLEMKLVREVAIAMRKVLCEFGFQCCVAREIIE